MATGESVGAMEGAFFVSKSVILDWLNELLDVQLTKIEQCATGSVYVQVMDAIYPGTFSLAKVKWGAKFDYEFAENYKVLQNAFDKNGIKKHIDVDKLVKARPLDNLEFIQWMKSFFDKNYSGQPYNALERRKGQDIFYIGGVGSKNPQSLGGGQAKARAGRVGKTFTGGPGAQPNIGVPKAGAARIGGAGIGGASAAELKAKTDQIAELKMNNDTLDREREFYFGKLRDIEEMLQKKGKEQDELGAEVLKVLYASEEEQVSVDEKGQLTITSLAQQ